MNQTARPPLSQSRRFRIAFVIGQLGRGGNEKQLLDLTRHLDGRVFDTAVIPLSAGGALEDAFRRQGTRIITSREGYPKRTHRLAALRRVFAAMAPDIVHGFDSAGGLYGRLAGWLSGVPILMAGFGATYISSVRLACAEYLLAGITDCVVCNTEEGRRQFMRCSRLPLDRVAVVPNGLDLDAMNRDEPVSSLRRELGVGPLTPLVGMVGKLTWEKDPATFIRAAEIVCRSRPDARFCLVGNGVMRREMERLIRRLNLASVFHLIAERADGPWLAREFHIAVLSSKTEGLPNAILEYMYWGKPCVVTDVGASADVVIHGETGVVVPPGNVEGLAAAILTLLDNPAHAERLGTAGRMRLESTYGIDRYVQNVLSLYQSALTREGLLDPFATAIQSKHSVTPV